MKLTATVKLQPDDIQRQLLFETLETVNAVCNAISQAAWDAQVFGRVPMHWLTCEPVRQQFGLAAQLAVRCIGKVVDAYKLDKKTKRQFKKLGAVPYDSRILNWRMVERVVSIWLMGGRQEIPFVTATDSTGESYSGWEIQNVRHRHRRLRRKLQKKSTKGAHRRLKILAGKEQRFGRHVNHTISKGMVAKAKGTACGIALEDLTHIRSRITAKKS